MDRWLVVDAGNVPLSWDAVEVAPDPVPLGFRLVPVPFSYPEQSTWNPNLGGFVDLITASPLITVGRFKLLFTRTERKNLRAAASVNEDVEDFMDLLNGFSDGLSLSDPMLITALRELVEAGLLTSERRDMVLAGQTPTE